MTFSDDMAGTNKTGSTDNLKTGIEAWHVVQQAKGNVPMVGVSAPGQRRWVTLTERTDATDIPHPGGEPITTRPPMFGRRWSARHLATAAALSAAPLLCGLDAPSYFERSVLDELNFARTDPSSYAESLREYRAHFRGRVVYAAGDEVGVSSVEGPAAVDEAITFLDRQRPLAPLTASPPLARAAAEHTADQGPLGLTGHGGSDGGGLGRRIQRYGVWSGMAAEDISYGADTAADVVRQLIIDDGVASRGHRANIFDPTLEIAGVGCGPHRVYRYMCVIDFAGAVVVR